VNEFNFGLIVVIMFVFLAENFIFTILYRRDIANLQKEIAKLFQNVTRLATMMEGFSGSGKKKSSGAKSVQQTQVLVGADEIDRLREIERWWNKKEVTDIADRIRSANKTENADAGAIAYSKSQGFTDVD